MRLVALFLLVLGGPAWADVIHLRNGRKLEGRILEQTRDAVHLEVREGGRMVLPRTMIEAVEERGQVQDEYGARYAELDLCDPVAIEALSLWASSKGLTKEARDLHQLSLGVRLDQLVAAAQRRDSARTWLAVFDWALRNDMSQTVLEFLLHKAEGLHTRSGEVQKARQALQRELAQRQRRSSPPASRGGHHYPRLEDLEDSQRAAQVARARRAQVTRRATRAPSRGSVRVSSSD